MSSLNLACPSVSRRVPDAAVTCVPSLKGRAHGTHVRGPAGPDAPPPGSELAVATTTLGTGVENQHPSMPAAMLGNNGENLLCSNARRPVRGSVTRVSSLCSPAAGHSPASHDAIDRQNASSSVRWTAPSLASTTVRDVAPLLVGVATEERHGHARRLELAAEAILPPRRSREITSSPPKTNGIDAIEAHAGDRANGGVANSLQDVAGGPSCRRASTAVASDAAAFRAAPPSSDADAGGARVDLQTFRRPRPRSNPAAAAGSRDLRKSSQPSSYTCGGGAGLHHGGRHGA